MPAVAMRQRAMSESVFERKYRPLTDSQGVTLQKEFSDVAGLDVHFVWTIVDADCSGKMYLVPGFHVVNRMGYVQTEVPWTDAQDAAGLSVRW